MRTRPVELTDWQGVFPVPPLARQRDEGRAVDIAGNTRVVSHIKAGGIRNLLYGGNAFLYHLTLGEFEQLLDWLTNLDDDLWAIPSAGPSYGRLIDHATMLRRYKFPCVMHLPCADPRDARGLEQGLREFADTCGMPLIVYLKEETNFGADREAGLDAVARLVESGVCIGIKYAVVRSNPSEDPYLSSLLQRVDRRMVLSGIGERPAVSHMRDFGLPGFTTGSGCLAPDLSLAIHRACSRGDYAAASEIRERFLMVEDLRDSWGPARVLHAAVTAAGVADCGPIPPFVSGLSEGQIEQLRPVALHLANARAVSA